MGKYLAEELLKWRSRQIENEKEMGDSYVYTYSESDGRVIQRSKGLQSSAIEEVKLVCTGKDGQIYRRTSFRKILKAVGLNAHSFHHTHATQLIESGANAKGVACRLGHSTVAITQNLYTHNTRKLQVETAEIFDKILQTNV